MTKHKKISFDQAMKLMRKRNPQFAEDGFHYLLNDVKTFLPQLLDAFENEQSRPIKCWLLELIGEARSDAAFKVLCDEALSTDESLRTWGIRGLKLLENKAARTFLYEHGLNE